LEAARRRRRRAGGEELIGATAPLREPAERETRLPFAIELRATNRLTAGREISGAAGVPRWRH